MSLKLRTLPRPSQARREAGHRLAVGGNRLLLILAALVLLAACMLYVVADMAGYYLTVAIGRGAEEANAIGEAARVVVACLLTLFFILPLVYGLLHITAQITEDKNPVLIDVLYAFTGPREYWRALQFSLGVVWRLAIFFAITDMTAQAMWGRSIGMSLLCVPVLAAEVMAFLWLSSGYFFVPFLMTARGMSCMDAVRASRRAARHYRSCTLRYLCDYLPWLLVSFFTIGVLFFADTLPRMLVSYFAHCDSTYEMIIQSEE